MKFEPKEPQRIIIEAIQQNDRCNVFASPGVGKTGAVLTALNNLMLTDYVFPALVVGPLRVANSVWSSEIRKWDHVRHLEYARILGPRYQREAVLNGMPKHIYTIHYGLLKWLKQWFLDNEQPWPFKTVICDESSRIKGHRCSFRKHPKTGRTALHSHGAVNAASLMRFAPKTTRWINLTGTPASNGLGGLWGQNWPIDYGNALGSSYKAFTDRWFYQRRGASAEQAMFEPMPHAFDEITRRLKPHTVSINAYDYFDCEKPNEIDVEITLPEEAIKQYRKFHRESLLKLSDEVTVNAVNAGVATNKCLQFASGHLFDNKGNAHHIHDAKIEYLESLVEELDGAPLLVAYQYKPDRDRILGKFPKAELLPRGNKQKAVENRWNRGEIPILVVHPASCGHGLSLQDGGHHVCIYTPSWDLELYQQIIERIGPIRQMQSGYDRIVHVYRLIAKHTWDKQVVDRISGKYDLEQAVMEELKDVQKTEN